MERRLRIDNRLLGSVLTAALAAAPLASTAAPSKTSIYWKDDIDLVIKTHKLKGGRTERMLDMLDIRPGMTVLDIGAGAGEATVRIAERLKGRGEVYATDIDPRLVDYVNRRAREKGFNNMRAVLVRSDGVDPFYATHRYDLILLNSVISNIDRSTEYLAMIKSYLTSGGRLAICDERLGGVAGIFMSDFSNFNGFLKALEKEPVDSPLRKAVWEPARKAAAMKGGNPRMTARSVIFHLNRLLFRIDLLRYFTDGFKFKDDIRFTSIENEYAIWRLHRVKLDGLLERNPRDLPPTELMRAVYLNKLIVLARFRPYFFWDGPHPYITSDPMREVAQQEEEISARVENAGYSLVHEFDLPPFQSVWVFKAAKAPDPARPPSANR